MVKFAPPAGGKVMLPLESIVTGTPENPPAPLLVCAWLDEPPGEPPVGAFPTGASSQYAPSKISQTGTLARRSFAANVAVPCHLRMWMADELFTFRVTSPVFAVVVVYRISSPLAGTNVGDVVQLCAVPDPELSAQAL